MMRAAAAGQFTLSSFWQWQLAIAAIALIAALGMLAWSTMIFHESRTGFGTVVAGALATLGLVAGVSSARMKAVVVRWDGNQWNLSFATTPAPEPWTGEMRVCVDLGGWMLLRFQRRSAGHASTVIWLPAQRAGLESQWHAMRCALYSPRLERDRRAVENP